MGVYRRAVLYIRRKRGQTTVLFFLFCIVSTFLVTGWSVLDSADAVAKSSQVSRRSFLSETYFQSGEINEGVVEHSKGGKGQPVITEENIKDILGYEKVQGLQRNELWLRQK